MIAVAVLLLFDFHPHQPVHVGHGIASLYRPWIKSRLVPYARYPGNWSVKPTPRDLVCAHRTLPFWSVLELKRADGRTAYCVVLDRGPYGFCEKIGGTKNGKGCGRGERWRVLVRRGRKKGYYRGLVDATPAVHAMMGSNGWVTVRARLVGRVRTRRVPRLQSVAMR